jgi:hypothetical protein
MPKCMHVHADHGMLRCIRMQYTRYSTFLFCGFSCSCIFFRVLFFLFTTPTIINKNSGMLQPFHGRMISYCHMSCRYASAAPWTATRCTCVGLWAVHASAWRETRNKYFRTGISCQTCFLSGTNTSIHVPTHEQDACIAIISSQKVLCTSNRGIQAMHTDAGWFFFVSSALDSSTVDRSGVITMVAVREHDRDSRKPCGLKEGVSEKPRQNGRRLNAMIRVLGTTRILLHEYTWSADQRLIDLEESQPGPGH